MSRTAIYFGVWLMLLFAAGFVPLASHFQEQPSPYGLLAAKKRTAFYFGVWTAFCALIVTLICFAIFYWIHPFYFPRWLDDIREFGPRCIPDGILAGVGWWLLHRGGRQPDWLVYGLFALAVVLVSHMLFYAIPYVLAAPGNIAVRERESLVSFLFHGWLSVPVVLFGTSLFVARNRRRLAANSR